MTDQGRGARGTSRRRLLGVTASLVVAASALGACSSDSGSSDSSGVTTTSAAAVAGDPSAVGSAESTTTAPTGTTPGSAAASTDDPAATTTTAAPTTTTIPPTTTTTIPLVTAGAIVLVANSAGVPGAAGRLTATLQRVGFAMKEATDAAGYEESLDASKIYFRPEAEAAARSLAAVMLISSVTRMPTPAPIVDAQVGLADANVLIMLGRDLADKDIPGLAGR